MTIHENTILVFKNGYINRCKYVRSEYISETFIAISDEKKLFNNLKNGLYPIFCIYNIIYVEDKTNANELLIKLFDKGIPNF